MDETITYSSAYLRFISSFELSPNNDVIFNLLDSGEEEFVSKYYQPQYKVSELASQVLRDIKTERIRPIKGTVTKGSFLHLVENSPLRTRKESIYQLCKMLGLELFSIWYAVEHRKDYGKYFSQIELRQVRNNILYIMDYLGDKDEYLDLMVQLHELDIHVGYIQAQVPVIKGELSNG